MSESDAARDMAGPLIKTEGLTRVLPGDVPVTLVEDITMSVEPGEFLVITGPSGSGKSSLLYLLGLLDLPTRGELWLQGNPTRGLREPDLAALRLRSIGFVFQFHFLLPEFTSLRNVMLPMQRLGLYGEGECRRRAKALLETFGLGEALRKRPGQLSGGMRQRVAIARALANDPPLVLADEPTGNLDSRNSEIVFEAFLRIAREEGRTVIAVTHDEDFASGADRRIHLVDGRIAPLPHSAAA